MAALRLRRLFCLVLLPILVPIFGNNIQPRKCTHHRPKASEVIHNVHLEPAHILKKRSVDQPLRVALHYDKSVNFLNTKKFDLIYTKVLPEAVSYWENTLMVRKTTQPIRLNRRCRSEQAYFLPDDPHPYCFGECEQVTMCGEVAVPENHLEQCRVCQVGGYDCHTLRQDQSTGVSDADFILYISAMNTERCNKSTVVAYAAHCQQEAALDRPIAGHANLCPESISTKPQELEMLISTVKHEMLHALGFSISLYGFFRDKDGNPLTPRGKNGRPQLNENNEMHEWSDRVIRKVTRRDWQIRGRNVTRTVLMMVTPKVVEEVRKHFDCLTLEGAELEDQGGEGTELTHWEKRVFENEAMTGTHTQNPVYSRITLAMMEDTGWYMPNYNMAEELRWGRGLGCDFVKRSCKDWMESRQKQGLPIQPFCNKVKRDPPQTECMQHRNAVALCNLVEYVRDLPEQYQNFDSIPTVAAKDVPRYGGSVDLSDYCPYLQEFTWKSQNVVLRGSQCHYEENNPKPEQNFALELYSQESKCFDHGQNMWQEKTCGHSRVWLHWGSGCYKYSCDNRHLILHVFNYSYTCFSKGQEIQIQIFANDWLHIGSIVCPSCEEICYEENMKCLPDEKVAANVKYNVDHLPCKASCLLCSWTLGILLQLLLLTIAHL